MKRILKADAKKSVVAVPPVESTVVPVTKFNSSKMVFSLSNLKITKARTKEEIRHVIQQGRVAELKLD